ncbi:hypothetical protein NKH70_34950, partial [Mesorhizobium sp. M0991]|uniref:hypothetical protein n=1 Tax=Mesorhizobium sp. M0991 TaxID=2957043 RepID=UPI0033351B43
LVFDRPAPDLGEHTVEILRETGIDQERIYALIAGGAIRVSRQAGGSEIECKPRCNIRRSRQY